MKEADALEEEAPVVVVELATEITLSTMIVIDLAAKIPLAAIFHTITVELLTKIT
ncbi:hypothetical protein [Escherichia coli]|uniref:hypothetical protein n=1 Tax=Escherichia coli TaxID=562 RepID=UPI0032DB7E53